jgi:hypothetical protein
VGGSRLAKLASSTSSRILTSVPPSPLGARRCSCWTRCTHCTPRTVPAPLPTAPPPLLRRRGATPAPPRRACLWRTTSRGRVP